MNKGPNQPHHPGHRRRRRRRGGPGKGQPNGQPGQHQSQPQGQQARGRRHGRNRRPATFVGPMDHSYRNGQNGNVADAGQQRNRFPDRNGNGPAPFHDPELVPLPVREDAPPRIFCFVDDLFFLAKIQEIARKLRIKVEFVKSPEPVFDAAVADVPEEEKPSLVVLDLNNVAIKPLSLIPKLRAKLKKGVSIIGFLNHLQGDLKLKAQEAGCDVVMPRSAFSQTLPQLLRRHGAPELATDTGD